MSLAAAGGAAAKVKQEREREGGGREALRHRQLGFLSGRHTRGVYRGKARPCLLWGKGGRERAGKT